MRRVFVRICGAVMAVMIIAVAGLAFFAPLVYDEFASFVVCLCMPPQWHAANEERLLEANGWIGIWAGSFSIYLPPGSEVHPRDAQSGVIVTPRFKFTYEFGAAGFAPMGRDVIDEPVRIDGHPATLRRADMAGTAEPRFAGLFVPQAIRRDGKPVSLLIWGTFRNSGDRAMADAMLATVRFRPPPPLEGGVQPAPVKVEPPVFDIGPDPA